MSRVIRVIGIGENGAAGLSQETLEHIERADLLVGGERQLAFFKAFAGEKRALKSGLSVVVEELGRLRKDKDIVVLASGDPLFFGIAGYLSAKLGAEHLDILPHLSSVQLAFARLGEAGRMRCWKAYTAVR